MYELASHLGMTVGELCYGRGAPMSAHELTVGWPAFFAYRDRVQQAEAEKARVRR